MKPLTQYFKLTLSTLILILSFSVQAQITDEVVCLGVGGLRSVTAHLERSRDFKFRAVLHDGFLSTHDEMICTSVGGGDVIGGRITCKGYWQTGKAVVAVFNRYIPGVMEVQFARGSNGRIVTMKCEGYID